MRRKFRRRGSGRERNSRGGFDRGKIWEVGAIQEHRPFDFAQDGQDCLCHEDKIGHLKVAVTGWGTECANALGG